MGDLNFGISVEIIDEESGISGIYDVDSVSQFQLSYNFNDISSLGNYYYNYAVWTSPSGNEQIALVIEADDDLGGNVYSGQISLTNFTENGTWTLDSFHLTDDVGNQTVLSTEDLIELGIETELEITGGLGIDSNPPELVYFDMGLADDVTGIQEVFLFPNDYEYVQGNFDLEVMDPSSSNNELNENQSNNNEDISNENEDEPNDNNLINNGTSLWEVKGTPVEGQYLYADLISQDPDGDISSWYYYSWQIDNGAGWEEINSGQMQVGNNPPQYLITDDDIGGNIKFVANYVDSEGESRGNHYRIY